MVSYCLKKRKPLLEKMKKEMRVMVMIIKPTCKQPIEEIERDRRPEGGEENSSNKRNDGRRKTRSLKKNLEFLPVILLEAS